jgi:hypothetical protein
LPQDNASEARKPFQLGAEVIPTEAANDQAPREANWEYERPMLG